MCSGKRKKRSFLVGKKKKGVYVIRNMKLTAEQTGKVALKPK